MIWKDARKNWLLQIARDPLVRDYQFKVAYFLAERVDRNTHEVWPQAIKIARKYGMKTGAVTASIEWLVARSHLELLHSSRSGLNPHCKIYRPLVKKEAVRERE